MPDILKTFIGKTISKACVSPRWDLLIEFTDHTQFEIPAAWDYEALELHGPKGQMIDCRTGGGGLAIWAQGCDEL